MGNSHTKSVLLTDLIGNFRRHFEHKVLAIDFAFEVMMQRIVCEASSLGECTFQVHAQPLGQNAIRIVGTGTSNAPIGFDKLEIFLPYGQYFELGITDICKPSKTMDGWVTIGPETHWVPHGTMPPSVLAEFGDKPDGTIWSHRGQLFLLHDKKYYHKFF